VSRRVRLGVGGVTVGGAALLVSRCVRLGVGGVTVGGCCPARVSAHASGHWRADGGVEAWLSVSARDVAEQVGGVEAWLLSSS
jgi:hypothetical protein